MKKTYQDLEREYKSTLDEVETLSIKTKMKRIIPQVYQDLEPFYPKLESIKTKSGRFEYTCGVIEVW